MPMSDKVLRAINKGRKNKGLKPIRRKKKVTGKIKGTGKMNVSDRLGIKKKIKKNMKGHEAKGSGSWKKGAKC
jgi:hypothetical protein